MGKGGAASVLLTFIDAWNMVEQPMVFLSESGNYPISVFHATVHTPENWLTFCIFPALTPAIC